MRIKAATLFLIMACSVFADREPSAFEGTYTVTRTNMKTGESDSEELRISWFGGCYLFEFIQGGGGGELVEQEGVDFGDWTASSNIDYGATVGLYRKEGDDITGVELYIPDTTFYVIKSGNAESLELAEQWARGSYQHFEYFEDGTSHESSMELLGNSTLWTMKWFPWWADSRSFTGCGLASGSGVAMLFEMDGGMILRLYAITGGNLEGRWLSKSWDAERGGFKLETGAEELWVQKLYE